MRYWLLYRSVRDGQGSLLSNGARVQAFLVYFLGGGPSPVHVFSWFKPTEELFAELLRTFFTQLSQAPSDLFGDDLTKENFLGSCALSLLEICNTDAPKLQKRCSKLRELVEEKFGLSTEDLALLGEDAPEVVDLQGQDFILREDCMGAMDWWTGFAPPVLWAKERPIAWNAADGRGPQKSTVKWKQGYRHKVSSL